MSRPSIARAGGLRAAGTAALLGALAALSACTGAGFNFGGGPDAAVAPVTGEVLGDGPVRVALLVPLSATGNAGQVGQSLKNAADLAIREFQTAGIQVLVKDDRGTPEGARAAASAAIAEGAELIMGPLFAQSVSSAASVARPANVPIVAFSTDTSTASPGVYLLSFLPQSDVDRIIGYAGSEGKRSFAALLPNNAYGTVVEAALQRAVASAGGRVMVIERYDLDRTSMQERAMSVAELVKSGTVDSVFLPDAGDAAPFLAQILAASGVSGANVQYLGTGQWDDPRVIGEAALNGGWFPAPERAAYDAFAQRYQTAFGSPPARAASLAYDATSLAAGLAARFGEQRFADQTLTNPSGFVGVDGIFRFLANGTNERGLAVYRIDRGSVVVISPAPKSFTRPGA